MKLRKIYQKYIILFLIVVSIGTPIDAANLEAPILEYGALYEFKMSNVPLRINILREVKTKDASKKIAVFKASSPFIDIDQKSTFILNEGQIVPLEYSYKKRTMGKIDRENFNFDKHKNLREPASLRGEIGGEILDKLSVQYQLQLDLIQEAEVNIGRHFSYRVQDNGRIKPYIFVVASIEKIKTELGDLQTLRIIRERKKENRSTTLWLAPAYDYTLVKMIQREGGKTWQLNIKEWNKKR